MIDPTACRQCVTYLTAHSVSYQQQVIVRVEFGRGFTHDKDAAKERGTRMS